MADRVVHSTAKKKRRVVLMAPVPPPMHGAAYAVELLLHSSFRDAVELEHIDAKFVNDIRDLQQFTPKKALLALKYWWALVRAVLFRGARTVILTPAFYPKPFLKDALYIWTAKLLGAQVVAWYHMHFVAMRYETLSGLMQRCIAATLRAVDRHVCVGTSLIDALPAFLDRTRVSALHNGIPALACDVADRAVEGERLRIVYLSNLGTAKGWRVLFGVAERLCARYPQVEVHFYGSPMADSPPEEVHAVFARSSAPERIVYHGPAYGEAKAQALCRADMFCFPSLNEAFPLTVLEAMSVGLPIVATDVGAVREAVEDGRGGSIVAPGDSGALEHALVRLIESREQRQAMGAYNRERFLREFTVEAFARRWRALAEHL